MLEPKSWKKRKSVLQFRTKPHPCPQREDDLAGGDFEKTEALQKDCSRTYDKSLV